MKQTHIINQESIPGDRILKYKPRRRFKINYIYPEPNKERTDKVLKELAQYFASKIQKSSTR